MYMGFDIPQKLDLQKKLLMPWRGLKMLQKKEMIF